MTYNKTMKFAAPLRAGAGALIAAGAVLVAAPSLAATGLGVTPDQKALADQVAQAGVALSALAPDAPESYVVKAGDTLWAVSKLFLKSPWRWPELWGMNLNDIKNPHLIYPGQKLTLEKKDGRATLRTAAADTVQAPLETPPTVRLSPRTRMVPSQDDAIPALKIHLIEPFLAEPSIVEEDSMKAAARIVASRDGRLLLTRGDRAYARGQGATVLQDELDKKPKTYRVLRHATPLKDPISGEILGYEAQYVGKALLVRSESVEQVTGSDGSNRTDSVPATIDITAAKEEMHIGDRLLPEPERQLLHYVPHAPKGKVDARIMSVYGNAVANAGQNQVVTINRGSRDGIDNGQVLAILKDGLRITDRTDEARTELKLPDERNGLLMVFRTFEKLSYALILEITDVARVGDRLVNPR